MRVFASLLVLAAFAILLNKDISAQTQAQPCPLQDYRIVSDFDVIKAGEIVSLNIQTKDGKTVEGEFKWTVSTGTIISGQATSQIKVLTPVEAGKPKPIEPPPNADKDGYIITITLGSRPRPFRVTAELTNAPNCSGIQLSTLIQTGTSSAVFLNRPPEVVELLLDKDSLAASCDSNIFEGAALEISVEAIDPDDDVLIYDYKVTAGKIVGQGAKVRWDLTGVAPGVYSITVGADDGCGDCGKTITKTVTVSKCN